MQTFKIKQAYVNQLVIASIALIAVGVFSLFTFLRLAYFLGIGILLFAYTFWLRDRTIITLHDDYLEMKIAIAAPKILLEYKDIKSVERKGDKAWMIADYRGTAGKKISLPFALLVDNDKTELFDELSKRTAGKTPAEA